jgi:hypothetical protein
LWIATKFSKRPPPSCLLSEYFMEISNGWCFFQFPRLSDAC